LAADAEQPRIVSLSQKGRSHHRGGRKENSPSNRSGNHGCVETIWTFFNRSEGAYSVPHRFVKDGLELGEKALHTVDW
jgi:hypothetical protein